MPGELIERVDGDVTKLQNFLSQFLVQVILKGSHMTTPQGSAFMPPFEAAYSDVEIAALSNYVLGHFGGKKGTVTPEKVAAARELH